MVLVGAILMAFHNQVLMKMSVGIERGAGGVGAASPAVLTGRGQPSMATDLH